MEKEIEIVFHNTGLRSYIEVSLCADCPLQDGKGCCGNYSPVFYPTDFGYLLKNSPALLEEILNIQRLTILDASLTVNNTIDGSSYKCHFHTDKGCRLAQEQRESICRHFVCPGIGWENEKDLLDWKQFFIQLADYEIELNNRISELLKEKGLTLRNETNRRHFFDELLRIYDREIQVLPDFFAKCPSQERFILKRDINPQCEWPL